jgi:hypothetical protein
MNQEQTPKLLNVKFWDGLEAEVDVDDVASRSLSVKGASCKNPLRFLEIYSDAVDCERIQGQFGSNPRMISVAGPLGYEDIKARFFPSIPGQPVDIGPTIDLPPFCWREADAKKLCVSFTYNANAFYRIFKNLNSDGKIPESQIANLLDQGCLMLAQIYKAGHFHVIKHINNNFNMYLISRVVEELVGRDIYSSVEQELNLTSQSLATALKMAPGFASYSVLEKMGFALGMGVAFIEQRIRLKESLTDTIQNTEKTAHEYFHQTIAIDDRIRLLQMVSDADTRKSPFVLAAILDDATETVIDLLWMQDLMEQFPNFRVNLLVNTAQISINFSIHMLDAVLSSPCFRKLSSRLGKQFQVTKMYCPFISFQTNYIPPSARHVINESDAVYIKGANFFETCQIPEKESFHAFVVFGPISRAYSGLNDYEAVFAYLPGGIAGYIHHSKAEEIVTLKEIIRNRDGFGVVLPPLQK